MGTTKDDRRRGPKGAADAGHAPGPVKAASLLDELVDIAKEDAKALRRAVSEEARALTDDEAKRLASYMRAITDVERTRAPRKGELDGKDLEALVAEAMEIPEFREIME